MNVSVRGHLDQEVLEKLLHLSFLWEILLRGRPEQKASKDRGCKEETNESVKLPKSDPPQVIHDC